MDALQQLVDVLAAVVAREGLVQPPPNVFDRIVLGCVLRQEVQAQAMSPLPQICLHSAAGMERSIVANHVNDPEATQSSPQVIQVGYKQLGIAVHPCPAQP